MGRGDGTAGLGLDDDPGDVVRDRVVEIPCKLFALPSFGLVDVPGTRIRVVANGSAQGGGEQEESEGSHRIWRAGRVSDPGTAARLGDRL
nr:hypothetical protein [Kocuria atrinae]